MEGDFNIMKSIYFKNKQDIHRFLDHIQRSRVLYMALKRGNVLLIFIKNKDNMNLNYICRRNF